MEDIRQSELAVFFDATADTNLDSAEADLVRYSQKLWDSEIEIQHGPPDYLTPYTLWFSTSPSARDLAGNAITTGYIMKRIDTEASHLFLVYAPDTTNLVYGLYAFLEELGIRFFHPRDEFVPHYGKIVLPRELSIERHPVFDTRGIHVHLLHPLEYFKVFNEPGDDNLSDAHLFIDWLVKSGQNYLQWSILKTVDFEGWKPHAQAVIDYAHQRGVKVGAEIQLWEGSSLQNSYVLLTQESGWQAEMEAHLDQILTIQWDQIEIDLGEFLGTNPTITVTWLNYATDYIKTNYPQTDVSAVNHVGNYPNLWLDYGGQTVFYYHLPGFSDPRLINNVHTVFFFDLYRNWGGYGHPNFHLQKDFIMQQLPLRKVRYKPESAYWVSADIDVPLFLPEYIYSRWIDIHNLPADIAADNLPRLDGHILYSSGHEWGYWMTDYLTAKMQWEPEKDFGYFIDLYAGMYGQCANVMSHSLMAFIDLQTEFLFDKRLVPYISGEDMYDNIGYEMGIVTIPKRVQFEELLAMSDDELNAFKKNVVDNLDSMARSLPPLEHTVKEICIHANADQNPWCSELFDGMRITGLRLAHSAHLYKAVMDRVRGGHGYDSYKEQALHISDLAGSVIKNRESHYRFDIQRMVGSYSNPTIYPFGYLKQAHTQCLWKRQEKQAEIIIKTLRAPLLVEIPACVD